MTKPFGYKSCTGLGLTRRRKTSRKIMEREAGIITFQCLQAPYMPFFVSCFSCSFLVGGRILALDSIDSYDWLLYSCSWSFDFFAGLVAVVCMYQMKRFEKHRTWIFYITPTIYLLYMGFSGFTFAYDNQIYNEFFGPAGWVIMWVTIDINSNARYLNWQQILSSKGSYFNMQLRWHHSFSYLSHRWWCLSWWWVRSAYFLFWPGFVRRTDAVLSHSLSGCLSIWRADCLCFGVFGHCASVQSSRKLVESDW